MPSTYALLSVLLQCGRAAAAECPSTRSASLVQTVAVTRSKRAFIPDNLCMLDHLVPELIVLGAQKAGTSFLYAQLQSVNGTRSHARRPDECGPFVKEAHVFDNTSRWEEGVGPWARSYPACTASARLVSIDATPGYLRSGDAARRIAERYGGQARRVRFAVVLREPLARAQSAFYHYRAMAAAWGDVVNANFFQTSFQSYVEKLLRANGTHYLTPAREDPFWNSRYHAQLSAYLDLFDSSQFTIAPFLKVVGRDSFARHLAKSVGLDPTVARNDTGAVNTHSHPRLPDDLDPEVLQRAIAFVDARAGTRELGELLAGARGRGASLFEFAGDRASGPSISEWLSSSW
mmetsp:Transcript_13327/g.37862  ORF Transcript_13327/g.37862 Transcript_13327/m.37862 type:complete len:347 (-) Transcript_13327:40-1080(-)